MRSNNAEDRQFEKNFKDSLKVSSYMDEIYDKIVHGKTINKDMVPNLGDGMGQVSGNESTSLFPMTNEILFKTAASAIGEAGMTHAIQNNVWPDSANPAETFQSNPSQQPVHQADQNQPQPQQQYPTLSKNQWTAVQKYPALVELLGTPQGEGIVKSITSQVNVAMVSKVGKNSQEISKFAQGCKADRQNMKQYFVGENESWVCCVIASGPFRGDEAIYYNYKTDTASVLRKVAEDYKNVTDQFNVVHEYADKEQK